MTTRVPKAPVRINNFFVLDANTGRTSVSVNLSSENIDGQPLSPSNLYYQILIPGFKSFDVYTFKPENHPEITEPITNIPFSLTSGMVVGDGIQRNMYIYEQDIDNVGARMVYVDETGEYFSEPIFYYPVDFGALEGINSDSEVIRTEWYTVEGLRLDSVINNGIYLRVDYYNNGQKQAKMVMVIN